MIVPVLEPIKELVAIIIGDKQDGDRDNHDDYERMIFFVSDRCALHGKKVGARKPAEDRDQQKRS